MRMWMVDPNRMCDQHLLGEHLEIHMLVGSIRMKRNLNGFLVRGLLEPSSIIERHSALVEEMSRRDFKHNSPIDGDIDLGYLGDLASARVDRKRSAVELAKRCGRCKKMVEIG